MWKGNYGGRDRPVLKEIDLGLEYLAQSLVHSRYSVLFEIQISLLLFSLLLDCRPKKYSQPKS